MTRHDFHAGPLPAGFHWLNEPTRWRVEQGLHIHTDPSTDFWQRTHYGFQRDNGHALLAPIEGDFTMTASVAFEPESQYDQCGLMIRSSADQWIKVSSEFESPTLSRLGSVVTNAGYSDWATQDIDRPCNTMAYRVTRQGNDYLVEHAEDGQHWRQMRIARLHAPEQTIEAGLYACSPVGEGFQCRFHGIEFAPCRLSDPQ
ncbi:MAG: hypothetical protein AMXMBFR84_32120 [Candidatus Hydrogenedentota bacterium]